ncbi:MAG: hypothetical protein J6Y89_04955 [Lachnospiraceae bacterium]|nr:hypothetical protein [Lachnospiraceae bacterium]
MTELEQIRQQLEEMKVEFEDYQEMKARIGSLKTRIHNLADQVNRLIVKQDAEEPAEKTGGRWIPKFGETYYRIFADESIQLVQRTRKNLAVFALGNCFKTSEEAKFMIERLKVLAEMRKFTFKPDETDVERYHLEYGRVFQNILIRRSDSFLLGVPEFESEEKANACIDVIGKDRLIKYYFGYYFGI